ncbi:MAG: autotransporter-associated beta strand repeat-containing protein, partial [Kiritimatiellaeota bacterium]|nr:autotransporter-associated beta strand repeat-containing protein [Kiritimatiellota bacterium]
MSMKLIKKNLSKVIKASAVGCSLFFASHALGQTYWTGGGGDGKWSTGANWSGGTVPASDGVVQFTNAAPLAVSVETSTTVQEIHTAGVGDVTIDIASGIKLSVANGGATGIWASSADITVNGPGKLALSWGNGGSTDLLDIGAAQGRTLALNAEVVGIESDLSTGIEAYIGNQPNNGTLVMGYSLNAFTGAITRTTGQVLVVPTLAPAGFPSSVGTGNAFYMNQRGTLRYTGTGDSTDRNIHLAGNNGGQLDHSGTGPLVFSGGMSNTQNSAQDLILLGDSASDATISGNIANGVGTLAIRKEGSGTWILSGNNTFSGNITVNGGTLAFDSQLALGHASQIIMTSGATLALNPSGVAGFTKTLPVVNVNGGTLSIGGSSSTVTLDGLTGHDLDVVAAPGNTIFIVGFPMGLTPVWLTLNGGPAEYDGTFGLIPASVINTVPGFKTKDETLPNDAAVKAVIDTVGTGDPIALTANPNALYGITLTADGDAVVDTAGKTLNAGLIANASATNALTIGVAPKDGLLQPKTSSFAIPSSAAISNLNPVIWYDPSDASTVTLSGNTVTGLQNKGSSGSTMNAVVRSGFSAPLYATGTASDSVLPMVKVAANSQGLQSASNTGITGNNPRTLIAVMSRAETTLGFEVSFGNPSTAQWFALMHRDSNGNTRFSIFGTDLDMPRPENNVPVVLSILNGVGGDNSAWRGFQNKIPTGEVSGTIATADTVLSMGHRSNGSQTSQRGQVGEVLLFDKSLTDSERETVENYLLAKWQPMAPALALRSGADAPVIVNAAITEPSDRAVSLIKSGPGDVTLAGSATLSGPVLISDGNLILDIPNGTTDTLSGVTRGTGKLVKTGDGILIRPNNVANTYSGG